MTFLNAALAFGALAFTVPLIIHLLNRSRFKTVDWGAMHLLAEVVRTNQRRFRLDQLILLLVRCAIPVLLAFCLARPVWTGSDGAAGDGPVSLAIVLDDSQSMGAPRDGGPGGETRFDAAVEAVQNLVAGAGKGSDFAVIRAGGPPVGLTDAPTFDAAALRAALETAEPTAGVADLPAALELALGTLAGMSHADRELVVLSDFQTGPGQPGGLATDAADAFRRRLADLELPPAVTLLPVAGENATAAAENLSVDGLETPDRPVGAGRPVRLRATIRNHGVADQTVRAALFVNGAEAGVQSVTAPAGGTVAALFVHPFAEPGTHAVSVAATPINLPAGDALPGDDVGRATVRVLGRLPALLVDGAPSRKPLAGETDFLSIALTPLSFGSATGFAGDRNDGQPADLIETRTVTRGEFEPELLTGQRLVVLANVKDLSDEQLTALTEYVADGGSLLIAAGDRVDLNWHRERLYADGAGLLPRAWGAVVGGDEAPSRVLAERFDHPALEPFNAPPGSLESGGDLTAADVRRWMTVEDPKDDADGGRVIARLDTADPLLIVESFGRGTVVQMTTALDADWSDLPLRPSFVPLMQGLAATLATRPAPPSTLRPGEPAVALVPAGVEAVAADTPDGRRYSVRVTEEPLDAGSEATNDDAVRRLARFENTRLPGFYEFNWPNPDPAGSAPDLISPARFAVAADPRESVPGTLDAEAQAGLADALGATLVATAEEYRARDDRRRHGYELWRWLLAGLLAALLVEMVLQQWFSRPATIPAANGGETR
ncbi:BatA domain-containing protein [Alienimonas sp. DA493]|uniref:BatA domain-containing protein n=1 Tax=Alienimonas sp. DA493 TaxID=3373605 RepID=UPI0037543CBB